MRLRRTRAERHKAAGDEYERQGGSKAVRDRVDNVAARIAGDNQAEQTWRQRLLSGHRAELEAWWERQCREDADR